MSKDQLVQGHIGTIGNYEVNLEDKDVLDAKAGVDIEGFKFGVYAGGSLKRLLVSGLRTITNKTSTTWDDKAVDQIEAMLFPK